SIFIILGIVSEGTCVVHLKNKQVGSSPKVSMYCKNIYWFGELIGKYKRHWVIARNDQQLANKKKIRKILEGNFGLPVCRNCLAYLPISFE
ncbi:unnamed protein product, partial [marine sediment metagenome]